MQVPKARLICSAIRGQPQVGLRCFISITARMMHRVLLVRASFAASVKTAADTFAAPGPDGSSTGWRVSARWRLEPDAPVLRKENRNRRLRDPRSQDSVHGAVADSI